MHKLKIYHLNSFSDRERIEIAVCYNFSLSEEKRDEWKFNLYFHELSYDTIVKRIYDTIGKDLYSIKIIREDEDLLYIFNSNYVNNPGYFFYTLQPEK